ncbi:hypothetical protein [Marivita sp.]|uniref:hypothetical protein n=1 Tax=Marivita sp. TaxID=2003365 RepID=UPI003A87987F
MRTAALIAACLAALAGGESRAQASLLAELSLHDPVTGAVTVADDGEPVRLRVRLTDPVTGLPPRGVELLGWVRAVAPDNPGCERAAQNYRATRRTPVGSVDLNGILLATFNRDATLSVIDPKLNLYSSNMVAAHRLDMEPGAVAVSPRQMSAYVADPGTGTIAKARLTGPDRTILAEGLGGIASMVAVSSGDLWIGDDAGRLARLGPDGRTIDEIIVGAGRLVVQTPLDNENDRVAAYVPEGAALLLDGVTGHPVLSTAFSAPITDVTIVGEDGLLAVLKNSPVAEMRYADAPDAPIAIPLGTSFERIATGPDARIALAFTPGDSIVALIDLALGRVVQSLELTGATISEVTFTDNAAFILSHDGGFLGAVDLATVALGKPAILRKIDLGAKTERPGTGDGLLVPLFPSPQVIAVEPRFQTGWLVGEVASTVEMPPMDSIRLRGGVPQSVHVVDRSFQEIETGVFETVWAFDAGERELILTTYSGQLSTCVPFHVRGEVEQLALIPVRLTPQTTTAPVAGQPFDLAFHVTGQDETALPVSGLTLVMPSMMSGWVGEAVATADDAGVLRARVTFPHEGPFVVQPVDLPAGLALRSALILQAGSERKDQ